MQNEGARIAVEALSQLYGTKYTYGSVFADMCKYFCLYNMSWKTYNKNLFHLDAASGSSMDWAYEIAGIKYSYAVELRDTGDYGEIKSKKIFITSYSRI
jgi:hypothetical protein